MTANALKISTYCFYSEKPFHTWSDAKKVIEEARLLISDSKEFGEGKIIFGIDNSFEERPCFIQIRELAFLEEWHSPSGIGSRLTFKPELHEILRKMIDKLGLKVEFRQTEASFEMHLAHAKKLFAIP